MCLLSETLTFKLIKNMYCFITHKIFFIGYCFNWLGCVAFFGKKIQSLAFCLSCLRNAVVLSHVLCGIAPF